MAGFALAAEKSEGAGPVCCDCIRPVGSAHADWCPLAPGIVQGALRSSEQESLAEFMCLDLASGEFWIAVVVDRQHVHRIGPFDTAAERKRALDDLLNMTRSLGAKDIPGGMQ